MTSDLISAVFSPQQQQTLAALAERIKKLPYARLSRIPLRKDRLMLPLEWSNLYKMLTEEDLYFMHRTAFPEVYLRLASRDEPLLPLYYRLFLLAEEAPSSDWRAFLGEPLFQEMKDSELLHREEGKDRFASRIRILPMGERLLVTDVVDDRSPNQVWFGADTLHLLRFLRQYAKGRRFRRALEIGSGSGVVTLFAKGYSEEALGVDINPRALAYGSLNAQLWGLEGVSFRYSDLFSEVDGKFDLILSNPPYVVIPPEKHADRVYAHGGDDFGTQLEKQIIEKTADYLSPEGMALFVTASPVVGGRDILLDWLESSLSSRSLAVEVVPMFYNIVPEFLPYHRAMGIEHFWSYFILLRHAPAFHFTKKPVTWEGKIKSWGAKQSHLLRHRLGL